MKTYIALLRGINVSGHKMIKMELLREVLVNNGFHHVSTYIQSGNIVFDCDNENAAALEHEIAQMIFKKFGFDVRVRITTLYELQQIFNENPFAKESAENATQPYVAFLSDVPTNNNLQSLQAVHFGNDLFVNKNKVLYLWYGDSPGNTLLTNAAIEGKLKLKATSRNWKTVRQLMILANRSST
jgi:uncharacterized protein (DUF1697 family)